MVEFWHVALSLALFAPFLEPVWQHLNRRYRGKEVATVEERCCNLDRPLKLIGGRHSFLVLETFEGEKVRIDVDETTSEPLIQRNYFDGWPSVPYRTANAVPGQSIEDVIKTVTKVSKKEPYNQKTHCCQHIARDSLNEVCGMWMEELRSEYVQRLCHFAPEGVMDASLCARELYGHLLRLSNPPLVAPTSDLDKSIPPKSFILSVLHDIDDLRPSKS